MCKQLDHRCESFRFSFKVHRTKKFSQKTNLTSNFYFASVIFQMGIPPVSYLHLLCDKSEGSTFMGHCEASCHHFSKCSCVGGTYIFTSPSDIFVGNWILNNGSSNSWTPVKSPCMNQSVLCSVFTVVFKVSVRNSVPFVSQSADCFLSLRFPTKTVCISHLLPAPHTSCSFTPHYISPCILLC